VRRNSSRKLGPGSPPDGKRGRVICATFAEVLLCSLPTLLDIVADELFRIVLEDFVNLVE